MLSIGFYGNTVKILSTSNEAYTSYSTITMELLFATSSNLEHHSVIRLLTTKNVSTVEIHRQLVNVYGNCVTHSQVVCGWHIFCGKKSDYTTVLKVGRTREWSLHGYTSSPVNEFLQCYHRTLCSTSLASALCYIA